MIHGVHVAPLEPKVDDRGRVMELLRADAPDFTAFGQVYLATAFPGVVKAWHTHRRKVEYLVCVAGMVKVALFDPRPDSPTRGEVDEFFIGVWRPQRLCVPTGVWHGLKCISTGEALVIITASELYNPADPDEVCLPPDSPEIPYAWEREDG